MKFIQNESDLYNQVERISLVSSLAASLLLQQYAPIDAADGSGMNLMDLKSRTWDRSLLESCACGDSGAGRLLEDKLGQVKASDTTIIGKIDKYFVER